MARPLQLLLAEDNLADAELLLMALRRVGFAPNCTRVDTEPDFRSHLHPGLDLVISDYEMPSFNGLRALELVKERGFDLPFIIVSGTIGEELAVAAMRLGATDYLMKDRLARLGAAVDQAMAQHRLRRERLQAEQAAARAESKFRSIFENSVEGIFQTTPDGRMLIVNPAFARIAGYESPDDMIARIGTSTDQIHAHAADRVRFQQMIVRDGIVSNFVSQLRRQDGTLIWISANARAVRDVTGRITSIEGAIQDITERQRTEAALRESEARFRQVVENIQEVFWMSDVNENRLLYVSPGYEVVWGRTVEALYRQDPGWIDTIHPEDRERVALAARTQKDGTYDEQYRIIKPDGSIRWIRDKAFPIRDADGTIRRIVGTAEDITERRSLEDQFLRAQRLEAIGTLASGIAHDLNNILAPMMIVAPMLRDKLADNRDVDLLNMVEQSARRGAHIIKQLLTFSRGIEGDRGPVQLGHLIKEMANIMRETFPREIEILQNIPGNLQPVVGDATQLHQVLMNLCVNARDAMPEGGQLGLSARTATLTAADFPPGLATAPGQYVVLTVSDTGCGIPQDIRERIFEPFFTTKETGKGTGLGLSTVVGIVRSHGGFVTVDSEIGRGSVFHVYFPVAEDAAPATTAVKARRRQGGANELILLVDDESAIRETTRTVLEMERYRVLIAGNGAEAIGIFLQHRGEVRLLLTDMMMPVMGGLPLIRAIRKLDPEVRIVAMTGRRDADVRQELTAMGVTEILGKPCTQDELLDAIDRQLCEAF